MDAAAGVLQAAAAVMMRARPPQLLVCSLTVLGGELVVVKRREGEKKVDALGGIAGGRGRESKRAREPYLLLMAVWCVEKEI